MATESSNITPAPTTRRIPLSSSATSPTVTPSVGVCLLRSPHVAYLGTAGVVFTEGRQKVAGAHIIQPSNRCGPAPVSLAMQGHRR